MSGCTPLRRSISPSENRSGSPKIPLYNSADPGFHGKPVYGSVDLSTGNLIRLRVNVNATSGARNRCPERGVCPLCDQRGPGSPPRRSSPLPPSDPGLPKPPSGSFQRTRARAAGSSANQLVLFTTEILRRENAHFGGT